MTAAMDPPPARNPANFTSESQAKASEEPSPSYSTSTSESMKPPMGPPSPRSNPPEPEAKSCSESEPLLSEPSQTDALQTDSANSTESSSSSSSTNTHIDDSVERKREHRSSNVAVPYTIPSWSGTPSHQYYLEVLKDGSIIEQFDVNKKGAYMFGRVDLCDFALEHPTVSRFHAVIQYKSNGDAYLYDLGSTHGTFINKNQIKKKAYVELRVGDVIRFGHSSRLYIFQGPAELMPAEADLKSIINAKIQQEAQDREASLLRARLEASLADGISWGMQEDAIEENEDEVDEITWQTYKGQLTEKQQKTRDKVLKRLEKIAHMKKEMDAIRAKDIAQGGLTQGQQTQIARNEQRISQIMEELENLEETLNESIRESLGARASRTSRGKGKGEHEDEEDYLSDDDEFYDRTQKLPKRKAGESQSVETADSLFDKKEDILKEMENKRKLILDEDKMVQENDVPEAGDALDAYMSTVSSQLATDKNERLHKDLAVLQSELDRVSYLLKIADPMGDAARRRESKAEEPRHSVPTAVSHVLMQSPSDQSPGKKRLEHQLDGSIGLEHSLDKSVYKQDTADAVPESIQKLGGSEIVANSEDGKSAVYTVVKPQWLGAVEDKGKEVCLQEAPSDVEESDQFVNYKDRKKIIEKSNDTRTNGTSAIENAAPGLIIRKRKSVEKSEVDEFRASEQSSEAERKAEDAVALLLKHSRGYCASDEEVGLDKKDVPHGSKTRTDKKKPKRVLGPEKPTFLNIEPEYDSWVPPEGQSGDGWTSLNDRLGY